MRLSSKDAHSARIFCSSKFLSVSENKVKPPSHGIAAVAWDRRRRRSSFQKSQVTAP
jgi:hypothetical protein